MASPGDDESWRRGGDAGQLGVIGCSPEAQRRFAELYHRWMPVVRSSALELLGSEDDAEDAAQDVFARLWRNGSGSWRSIHSPSQFFPRVGRNEALGALRRLRPARPLTAALATALRCSQPGPEEWVARRELMRIVRHRIDELPPRCRMVMSLFVLEGLKQPEIAERLGIGIKAVEKQIARGRVRLREVLAAQLGEGRDQSCPFEETGGERTADAS